MVSCVIPWQSEEPGWCVCVWGVEVMELLWSSCLHQLSSWWARGAGNTQGVCSWAALWAWPCLVLLGNIWFSVDVLWGCLGCAQLAQCVWEQRVPCVWAPECYTDWAWAVQFIPRKSTWEIHHTRTGVWASALFFFHLDTVFILCRYHNDNIIYQEYSLNREHFRACFEASWPLF